MIDVCGWGGVLDEIGKWGCRVLGCDCWVVWWKFIGEDCDIFLIWEGMVWLGRGVIVEVSCGVGVVIMLMVGVEGLVFVILFGEDVDVIVFVCSRGLN